MGDKNKRSDSQEDQSDLNKTSGDQNSVDESGEKGGEATYPNYDGQIGQQDDSMSDDSGLVR